MNEKPLQIRAVKGHVFGTDIALYGMQVKQGKMYTVGPPELIEVGGCGEPRTPFFHLEATEAQYLMDSL